MNSILKPVKTFTLISETSEETFHAMECDGLVQCSPNADAFTGNFPITFRGLTSTHGAQWLPPETFRLQKEMHGKPVDAGYLHFIRRLGGSGGEQAYLATLWKVDLQKLYLLDCFLQGLDLSYSELDPSWSYSWLSACCTYHFTYGHAPCIARQASLSVSGLRSHEEFYCHVGDILFGRGGYAGRDLDGGYEILSSRSGSDQFVLSVEDEDATRVFLAEVSGDGKYYERFKTMISDAGGEVLARR